MNHSSDASWSPKSVEQGFWVSPALDNYVSATDPDVLYTYTQFTHAMEFLQDGPTKTQVLYNRVQYDQVHYNTTTR